MKIEVSEAIEIVEKLAKKVEAPPEITRYITVEMLKLFPSEESIKRFEKRQIESEKAYAKDKVNTWRTLVGVEFALRDLAAKEMSIGFEKEFEKEWKKVEWINKIINKVIEEREGVLSSAAMAKMKAETLEEIL